ncbi:MAG: NAD(P)H-dependent oxidoreductase [Bacteroidetes bacterium]|nr:NAD(P)H-dependent oxidoreductase [Bacteroidota bacterium]
MITIISATNRPNSNTLKVSEKYAQLMEKQGLTAKILSLEQVPADIAFNEVFSNRSEKFQQLLEEYIIPVQKFVIIAPEYNGSFPGILKTFFDAIHPDLNRGKKVALAGVASGRAGNLRGMDHLTGILNYLGMHVHPNKLPISSVLTLINADGELIEPTTIKVIEKQLNDFTNW